MNSPSTEPPTFLIVGATSAIATALARRLAARGLRLIIAGRDRTQLARLQNDLRTRNAIECPIITFDALIPEQVREIVPQAIRLAETALDGVVICHGITPNELQAGSEAGIRQVFEINFLSAAVVLQQVADHLGPRRRGTIAAISSVAGDRGRQSNFVYGASKAALSTFLQGLRNRLTPMGVHVLTIKPGFVNTPMTRGMKFPAAFLVAAPDHVAADIERAIARRRNVLYTPWFWKWIMALIRAIPEFIFVRLKL